MPTGPQILPWQCYPWEQRNNTAERKQWNRGVGVNGRWQPLWIERDSCQGWSARDVEDSSGLNAAAHSGDGNASGRCAGGPRRQVGDGPVVVPSAATQGTQSRTCRMSHMLRLWVSVPHTSRGADVLPTGFVGAALCVHQAGSQTQANYYTWYSPKETSLLWRWWKTRLCWVMERSGPHRNVSVCWHYSQSLMWKKSPRDTCIVKYNDVLEKVSK